MSSTFNTKEEKLMSGSINGIGIVSVILLFVTLSICGFISIREKNVNILLFAIFFSFLGLSIVRLGIRKENFERKFLRDIFIYGYVFRICCTLVVYYYLIYTTGEPFYAFDDIEYNNWGKDLSELWKSGQYVFPYEISRHPGYFFLSGVFNYIASYIGEYHVLIPRLFNCLVGALIPVYVFKIAYKIYDIKIAKLSVWFAFFSPELLMYSSVQMRDIIITLLFVASIFYLIEFIHTKENRNIFFLIFFIVIVSYFRRVYGVVLAGICLIAFLVSSYRALKQLKITAIFNFIIVLIILSGIFYKGNINELINPSQMSFSEQMTRGNVHSFDQFLNTEGTSNSLNLAIYAKVPAFIRPVAYTTLMLFMPYPPWVSLFYDSTLKLFEFMNGVFWAAILPFCIIGLISTIRNKAYLSFPLYATFVLMLYISGASYFTDRYRMPAVPFAFILSSLGIFQSYKYSFSKTYYAVFQGVLLTAYLFMKYKLIPMQYIALLFIIGAIIYVISKLRKRRSLQS